METEEPRKIVDEWDFRARYPREPFPRVCIVLSRAKNSAMVASVCNERPFGAAVLLQEFTQDDVQKRHFFVGVVGSLMAFCYAMNDPASLLFACGVLFIVNSFVFYRSYPARFYAWLRWYALAGAVISLLAGLFCKEMRFMVAVPLASVSWFVLYSMWLIMPRLHPIVLVEIGDS